jgi:hypothetical protein
MCKESRYRITTLVIDAYSYVPWRWSSGFGLLALLPEVLANGNQERIAWNEHIYGRAGFPYFFCLVWASGPRGPIPPSALLQVVGHVLLDSSSKWKFIDHNLIGEGHSWIDTVT